MEIAIFDVEHGGCSLIETNTGKRILVDCGYNSSTNWRPSTYLAQRGINYLDELCITNYDEDHVNDLPNLIATVQIGILRRNQSVSAQQLRLLKSECGIGKGMDCLANLIGHFQMPVSPSALPNWGDVAFAAYFNHYPTDFDDENNLSVAYFVHHPRLSVLFPGDLEIAGWRKLLQNPAFIGDLKRVHVLVASHHGRANGCCEEIFSLTGWSPQVVIISDAYKQHDTQETTSWYAQRATGINYQGSTRYVFTTRKDGAIYLSANESGASILTSR